MSGSTHLFTQLCSSVVALLQSAVWRWRWMAAWWWRPTTMAPATCGGWCGERHSPHTLSHCTNSGHTRWAVAGG